MFDTDKIDFFYTICTAEKEAEIKVITSATYYHPREYTLERLEAFHENGHGENIIHIIEALDENTYQDILEEAKNKIEETIETTMSEGIAEEMYSA